MHSIKRYICFHKNYRRANGPWFLKYRCVYHSILLSEKSFSSTAWLRKSNDIMQNNAFKKDYDVESSNFNFKSLLYTEDDEIIAQLNACSNEGELLAFIKTSEHKFRPIHFVQSILVLKDVFQDLDSGLMDEILKKILRGLTLSLNSLNIIEKSCCYLYLRKIGVPNTNMVMQQLLLNALKCVRNTSSDEPISLNVLSRLGVAINTGQDFHVPTVCSSFIPHIVYHIKYCNTEENLRMLSISIINLQQLITSDILEIFKTKVNIFIEHEIVNSKTIKTVIKLLHLLNLSVWSHKNGQLIRDLMLLLQPNLSNLTIIDLKAISRIFGYHLEPASLIDPLKSLLTDLFQNDPQSDILAAYMPFLEPHRRDAITSVFKNLLFSSMSMQNYNSAAEHFQIIRTLKISDSKLCDAYWENVLDSLKIDQDKDKELRFLIHCHRYMHFNNNLGGSYRFLPLERRLTQVAMEAIENDINGCIPSKFARLAAFVLAYGHTPFGWKKFPNIILSKIISMSDQFNIMDCLYLSRGIQIALELRFRNMIPSLLGFQLATIDSVLADCVERHLENKNLSIFELNTIMRTLGYKKSLKEKYIYQAALERYNLMDYDEINSRAIREMAYNFSASNCTVPIALEAMFTYIEKHHEHVIGETVEKVLSCAFNQGYVPKSESVLGKAATILKRDFKDMNGLSIVQACMALCYYKAMPEDLIDMVFCVKFIQRIEEEIQMCYSKATYPERVLNSIMKLNRTVCLDYPEANVPWFQQNYLEAQLSKKPTPQCKFGDEVKRLLKAVLSSDSYFRCNHITPYGYQIDFVIHFDKNHKPIAAPVETMILDRITKVAILLLRLDSFCKNDLTALRGPEHLRTKHLEMMGYKVIHINEHDWNTKYMNSPKTKTNYLKCLLQI